MKVSAILSFASLAAALPSLRTSSTNSNAPFVVTAARSGSPIHYLPLTASGGHFWLGGKSQTYCPSSVGSSCHKQNETIIHGGNFLDVIVPGGQEIYVDGTGALSFTQPHSAYMPGSVTGQFKYSPSQSIGTWTFSGQGASGFMACPVPQGPSSSSATPSATASPSATATPSSAARPQWQVYAALQNATVPSGKVSDCLGFVALAVPANVTSNQLAWEYI